MLNRNITSDFIFQQFWETWILALPQELRSGGRTWWLLSQLNRTWLTRPKSWAPSASASHNCGIDPASCCRVAVLPRRPSVSPPTRENVQSVNATNYLSLWWSLNWIKVKLNAETCASQFSPFQFFFVATTSVRWFPGCDRQWNVLSAVSQLMRRHQPTRAHWDWVQRNTLLINPHSLFTKSYADLLNF